MIYVGNPGHRHWTVWAVYRGGRGGDWAAGPWVAGTGGGGGGDGGGPAAACIGI